jgi:hypothetical protein
MERGWIEIAAPVADDLLALHVEDVDAPVRVCRQQVGRHGQELLRMPVGALGDAATLADIPITVGTLAYQHNHFNGARWLVHNSWIATLAEVADFRTIT